MTSAASIASTGISAEPAQIERLALQLANCDGDLSRLLGELGSAFCNNQADVDRMVALRYQSALAEQANPALTVKRLRAAAADKRKAYQRHMDDYGPEIGRATRRAADGQHVLAALAESAAAAHLAEATDRLKEAEALEHEADALAPWVVLFDGISTKAAA